MEAILRYLQNYEVVIYATLGFVALYYLFKLISSWQDWRGMVFGIEREIAQRRFRTHLNVLLLLILFGFLEFALVSFVAPSYPQAVVLATPTLDVLATPTVTLAPRVDPASIFLTPTPTISPSLVAETESCLPGKIEWISPKPGETISGTIQLMGTVNVPNLGFYKYEFAAPGAEVWSSIAANKEAKVNGEIGFWNTSQLEPGEYLLRLMVFDNQNEPFPACVVRVNVAAKME